MCTLSSNGRRYWRKLGGAKVHTKYMVWIKNRGIDCVVVSKVAILVQSCALASIVNRRARILYSLFITSSHPRSRGRSRSDRFTAGHLTQNSFLALFYSQPQLSTGTAYFPTQFSRLRSEVAGCTSAQYGTSQITHFNAFQPSRFCPIET